MELRPRRPQFPAINPGQLPSTGRDQPEPAHDQRKEADEVVTKTSVVRSARVFGIARIECSASAGTGVRHRRNTHDGSLLLPTFQPRISSALSSASDPKPPLQRLRSTRAPRRARSAPSCRPPTTRRMRAGVSPQWRPHSRRGHPTPACPGSGASGSSSRRVQVAGAVHASIAAVEPRQLLRFERVPTILQRDEAPRPGRLWS